jgi:hypothetical protein
MIRSAIEVEKVGVRRFMVLIPLVSRTDIPVCPWCVARAWFVLLREIRVFRGSYGSNPQHAIHETDETTPKNTK